MRGLDTETDKGLVILIATPDMFLETWRYRKREMWPVLLEWLECAGGSLADNLLPVSSVDLSRSGRERPSNHQAVENRGGPSATGPAHRRYVCWNADYDCQALLKLTPRLCREDMYRWTRTVFDGCRIRFVPSKFLWLAKADSRIQVFDLMQFYSMSLEKASRKLLGKGKRKLHVAFPELLSVLKEGGDRAREIQRYCMTDAERVEQIYEKSKKAMEEIKLRFDKPVSCASIAVQKFSVEMEHDIPRSINKSFQKTYRGGRIECLKCGFFARAYLSDIHSAYASVMSRLWRTIGGNWLHIKGIVEPEARFAAVLCEVRIPQSEYRGPLPVVGETQLIYPRGTWSQWVDLETYRLMEKRDMIVKIKKGWQLIPSSEDRPFKELETIYQQRLERPQQNWALKIVMNALYGKTAEQIGTWKLTRELVPGHSYEFFNQDFLERKQRWTQRTNFVYASAITAGIRNRMYRELCPESVVFYATDGVMTLEPPKLDVGPGLGQWGEPEEVSDLVVVGSGVYTYRKKDGSIVTKLRGLDSGLDLYTLLDRKRRILELTVRRNWSLAQSVRQHKYEMFNELVDVPRFLDVCFDRKRIWEKPVRMARELLTRSFDSRPWFYYPPTSYEEF